MDLKFWQKKSNVSQDKKEETKEDESFLTLNTQDKIKDYNSIISQSVARAVSTDGTQDTGNINTIKPSAQLSIVNNKQLDYFAKQGFIGFQTCSIVAQHWLVNKGVTIPAKDAIRNGYELTFNDGEEVDLKLKKDLRDLDKKFKIRKNLVEYVKFGRIFGIRIAIFKVMSTDKDYYEKPFNIDGVTEGSYKGISQVDPYWVTPHLSTANVSDPSSMDFYDPTYWIIDGKKYHRSHLSIMRTDEVSDILKPSYFYAGISYPQKVMNRVYSAEKTADEAPLLAQTKRTNVYKTNLTTAKTNITQLKENLQNQSLLADNYGIRVIGKDDEVTNLETTLNDLDAVIMTQFQVVAGELNVPISKLLGTPMKGFSGGEKEQDDYYEELENIQDYDMTPLLDRHYQLLLKSEFKKDYQFEVVWNGLKVLSETEKATIRETDSRTDQNYLMAGVVNQEMILNKLTEDKDSRYSGMEVELIDEEDLENFEDDVNKDNK
jgi:phage-related protein (TIGR01555 family)